MDISRLVHFGKLALILIAAWTIFRLARRLKSRWVRIPARALSAIATAIGAAVLCLLLLIEPACTAHVSLKSPDHRHVAIRDYVLGGALSADHANVSIRSWWSPFTEDVYSGEGGAPSEPEVLWLNASRLLIRYHDKRATCRTHIRDIEIVCESLPDPQ